MILTRFRAPPMAALGFAAALAIAACSENRPFESESAGAQALLAAPTSMTPPVSVRRIEGAPESWKLAERVAQALRSRDIPADAASRSRAAYLLKGALRPGAERGGPSRAAIVWSLYDGLGKKVGEVTQTAAVPGAAFRTPNAGAVEAMADAAADAIAPLVPSSSVQRTDRAETAARRGKESAGSEDRDRAAFVGRLAASGDSAEDPIDPTKPLPRPTADAGKFASAWPEPASDAGRRTRPGAGPPERPRQIAESPAFRPEAASPPRREQYAETRGRTGYEYWIQIGSNKDEASSRAIWEKMQSAAPSIFANIGNRIQRADLGARGVYYRIQVGPFASPGTAGQFCAQLKAHRIECFVAQPEAATARSPQAAPKKAALPAPKPIAKPADTKLEAPKPLAKPAEPKAAPNPVAKPAEKPKEAAAAPKKPDAESPAPLPETKPPQNDSAEKPEAPITTEPGLPGVLD